jgi:hypothetical protein
MSAMSRLMYRETTVSDMLALLIEREPAPLVKVLDLGDRDVSSLSVRREDFSRSGGKRAFQDLVVFVDDHPIAALEVKVSAGWHGQQEAKYLDWAGRFEPVPALFLVSPWGISYGESDDWKPVALSKFLGAWVDSEDPLVRPLAQAMRDEVDSWTQTVPGQRLADFATRLHRVLALRAVSASLLNEPFSTAAGVTASTSFGDAGGKAATYHWAPIRGRGADDEYVEVDVRSALSPESAWDIRFGIEVGGELADGETVTSAADRALGLAEQFLGSWSIEQIIAGLRRDGHHALADAVVPPKNARAAEGRRPDGEFFYDARGSQRFLKFSIDPAAVEPEQLGALIKWGLEKLLARASD